MEEIQKCCALETKKFFVMGWDTLIFLFNLYILYNDIIFIVNVGVITLMNLLSFALSIMWIVHYIYNCGSQYSEKYEWVIYIKFVYLINIILYVYYLMVGYPFNLYNIPLILFLYLISFVLEYIYLIHLKKMQIMRLLHLKELSQQIPIMVKQFIIVRFNLGIILNKMTSIVLLLL